MESKMTIVETKKRANSAYVYRMADGCHEWDYGNGNIVKCNADKGSAQARHFLLNYGVKQWVQDGGAVAADDDGKVDPLAKFEGMRERANLIESGVDQLLRRAGPRDETPLLMEALSRAMGWTAEQAAAWVDKAMAAKGLDRKAVLANVAKNPKVVLAVGQIRAERAAKGGGEDLLAEIEGGSAV
jgi:hypothetical protein